MTDVGDQPRAIDLRDDIPYNEGVLDTDLPSRLPEEEPGRPWEPNGPEHEFGPIDAWDGLLEVSETAAGEMPEDYNGLRTPNEVIDSNAEHLLGLLASKGLETVNLVELATTEEGLEMLSVFSEPGEYRP